MGLSIHFDRFHFAVWVNMIIINKSPEGAILFGSINPEMARTSFSFQTQFLTNFLSG